ncbi:hypothetical protein YB2330_006137 [Saitoella coloradoensis]
MFTFSNNPTSTSTSAGTSFEANQQEPVFQTGVDCLCPFFTKVGHRAPRTLEMKAEHEKTVVTVEIVEKQRGEIKDLLKRVPVTRKGGALRDLRATIKATLRTKGEDLHERVDDWKMAAKKNKAVKKVVAFAEKQSRKVMCPRFKEKRNAKFWTMQEHLEFKEALAEWYRMGNEFRAQEKGKKEKKLKERK